MKCFRVADTVTVLRGKRSSRPSTTPARNRPQSMRTRRIRLFVSEHKPPSKRPFMRASAPTGGSGIVSLGNDKGHVSALPSQAVRAVYSLQENVLNTNFRKMSMMLLVAGFAVSTGACRAIHKVGEGTESAGQKIQDEAEGHMDPDEVDDNERV